MTRLDGVFDAAIAGAEDTRLQAPLFFVAQPAEAAVLKHLEEFGLKDGIEIGDFIQQKGSAVRHFHAARLGSVGAGEGALLIAEQLAFEKEGGNCGATHFDPRAVAPRGARVNPTREQAFSRARQALNQDRNIGSTDLLQALAKPLHFGRAAENHFVGRQRRRRIARERGG